MARCRHSVDLVANRRSGQGLAPSIHSILHHCSICRSHRQERLFSNDSTLVRSARDFGLSLVERMPALKQFFVAEAAGLTGDVPRLLRGEKV